MVWNHGSDSSMAFCMEILMVQVFGKKGCISSIMMGFKSVFTHWLKRTESINPNKRISGTKPDNGQRTERWHWTLSNLTPN